MNGPLACFLANLWAELELTATEVQIVRDNPAPPPGLARARRSAACNSRPLEEEIGRHPQRAGSRWQTDISSASHLLEKAAQHPLARLGPTMPRRKRSFDEKDDSDDSFCQAVVRECTITADQRVLRMPQRACSGELAVKAMFPDEAIIRSSTRCWERSEPGCHTGWQ
jgi:hypothetical protein